MAKVYGVPHNDCRERAQVRRETFDQFKNLWRHAKESRIWMEMLAGCILNCLYWGDLPLSNAP
jgi:hypothetical protein